MRGQGVGRDSKRVTLAFSASFLLGCQGLVALIARAGLPSSTRLHDLRHTHATLMWAQGVPVKVVSVRLGHANIAITLQVYGHLLPNMQEEAARTLEHALRNADS
jgi:integrase